MKNDRRGELTDHRGDRDGHDDRDDGDAHRDQRRHHGAEDEEQHDQGGRQAELQLPLGEVGCEQLVEVVVEGELAGDLHVEVGRCVGRLDLVEDVDDAGLGVVAKHEVTTHCVPVLGDGCLAACVGVADRLSRIGALDRGPDLRNEGLEPRVVAAQFGRVDDDGLVDAVALGEVLGDQLLGLGGIRVCGDAGIGGEGRADQAPDGHHGQQQDQPPGGDGPPGVEGGCARRVFGSRPQRGGPRSSTMTWTGHTVDDVGHASASGPTVEHMDAR